MSKFNWINVNLPWSPTEDPIYPPIPSKEVFEVEERGVFGGKTLEDLQREIFREWGDRRAELGALDRDPTPEEDRELAEIRLAGWQVFSKFATLAGKLPCWVAYETAREKVVSEWKKTHFKPQAKPGMLVETSSGTRFLLGDLAANGHCGGEYDSPLEGEIIVRYCMLDLPPKEDTSP